MRVRCMTGPVFTYEWLITSRRWQVYAARSMFVATLLAGLATVWATSIVGRSLETFQDLATLGEEFYQAIVGIQFTLILTVAPAALAGAFCVDKSRGTLIHLMVTDLTDAEIVLGKLAARLIAVLGLLACTLPVLALVCLLGGVDPVALTRAFLVAVGLALLTSTLALTLSAWAHRPYEVLFTTYTVLAIWLLARPTWTHAFGMSWASWPTLLDPIELTFEPDVDPTHPLMSPAWFLLLCAMASAVLTTAVVRRIRAVAIRQASRGQVSPTSRRRRAEILRRVARRLRLTPSLDGNPVLWREWHRNRPSTWIVVLTWIYTVFATAFSAWAIVEEWRVPTNDGQVAGWVTGLLTAIGFLLLATNASTSLAEERARGSLDVLLATPLSTRSILVGKWLGAYRIILGLALAPGVISLSSVVANPAHWLGVPLVLGLILSYGAALTSLGLMLATWIVRQARVLALVVTAHLLVTVGWLFLVIELVDGDRLSDGLAIASAFYGPGLLTALIGGDSKDWHQACGWAVIWIGIYAAVAGLLFLTTLATFDRCLGRCSGTPRKGGFDVETTVMNEHVSTVAE